MTYLQIILPARCQNGVKILQVSLSGKNQKCYRNVMTLNAEISYLLKSVKDARNYGVLQ
jgi:hypothetical protein